MVAKETAIAHPRELRTETESSATFATKSVIETGRLPQTARIGLEISVRRQVRLTSAHKKSRPDETGLLDFCLRLIECLT